MKPVIAISTGDYNGIGPEVILKSFLNMDISRSQPLVIGHKDILEYYNRELGLGIDVVEIPSVDRIDRSADSLQVINCISEGAIDIHPGTWTRQTGHAAMQAIEKGAGLCMENLADALVTAPISKKAIQEAGYPYPGHTEFLAELTSAKHHQMILATDSLRVALATIHVPISEVASLITPELLKLQLTTLHNSLKIDFEIPSPRIAVLGLNPHAGDDGVIGDEEIRIIRPEVDKLRVDGITVSGPFAADGFFGNQIYQKYDAILAMYHDQGLIPFKTLSFGTGVNFTAGLPVIRTSPDHGTGFDIAGRNRASSQSFLAAYNLAEKMVRNKAADENR